MVTEFQTEYLFKRLPDFWSYFEDREDQKNLWDAFLRKSQALYTLLRGADRSKSLKSIPILDRNQLEYFIFSKYVRRTDLEFNEPFYVYEVDPAIYFIKNLYEKIDATESNRVLSPETHYRVVQGTGTEQGKTFLEFVRGVAPVALGETYWTKGSVTVTGTGLSTKVSAGDVILGPNEEFYKVSSVGPDQQVPVPDELLGTGNSINAAFHFSLYPVSASPAPELRKGTILGMQLSPGVHYTYIASTGAITLTPAGVIFLGIDQLHAKYAATRSQIYIQGTTILNQSVGSGDGSTTVFNLRTPNLFTEISDELVLTGPVGAGTYLLDNVVYDPATLLLRVGPSFDTGSPLTLGTDYTITNPNSGQFDLTLSGVLLVGNDQLHARYDRAEPYIITSSAEVRIDGRTVDPLSSYADELVATGPVAPGVFLLDNPPVDTGSLELRAGSITGTLLSDPADYSVVLATGQVTLTAAGAAVVNATSSKEIHAKYSRTEYYLNSYGMLTFAVPPVATAASVNVDYFLGYFGPTGYLRRTTKESAPVRLFSRAVYRDRKAVYTNFGYAIGYEKPTSMRYLNEVRGLYFARYNGPTITNMNLGAGILTGIPFSERGKVDRVQTTIPKSIVVNGNLIPVPDPLTPTVAAGDWLPRDFNILTDGVRTADFINDPALFQLDPIYSDIRKFFTFFVLVKGSYATWVCTQTGQPIDYSVLDKFISDIKPSYTDAMVLTDMDSIADALNFFIGAVDVSNSMDVAATVEFNPLNYCVIPEYMRTNGYAYTVGDELAATGPVAPGLFALDFDEILVTGVLTDVTPVPFELHAGAIGGPLLAPVSDYTLDPENGTFTLTAAGAAVVNAAVPPDIHAKYTSGIVDEASLAASDTVDLDLDCIQLYEDFHVVGDSVGISTLENNLVNFGVSPPGPEGMDDDTIQMSEAMAINDAIGTPPGSWNPPFAPGALLYSF